MNCCYKKKHPIIYKVYCFHFKKSLKISNGNQNPYIEEEQTTQWPKEKNLTHDLYIKIKLSLLT